MFEGAPLRLTAPRLFAHARLLLAEGQPAAALGELDALLPLLNHAGLRLWAVQARLLRAAALTALDRAADAAAERDAADATADGQPLRGLLRDAAGTTGGTGARPDPLPGGLSAREWDVVLALSGGCSNKEIARHLGITEGTVKNHRKNIYRKLGTSNRSRIVALAQGGA